MRATSLQSKPTSTPAPAEDPRPFRRVILIGLVSLFTDIATEMVFALLPLFVVDELGANSVLLGLMEGAAEGLNDTFRVISGLITNKISKRKPLLVIGYTISALAKPLLGVANNFTTALSLRLTDRVGKGTRTSARDVLLSETISEKQHGKAFGFHRSMDQTGAVVGPLLAYLLLPYIGVRGIFFFSIVPGIVAVTIVVFLVRDVEVAPRRRVAGFTRNAKAVLNFKLASYLAVVGIFAAGTYSYAFVLLKAVNLGVDVGAVPLVYATLNVATVLVAIPFGMVADRIGAKKVLLIAYFFFLVTTLGSLMVNSGIIYAYAIAFGFGMFLGTSDTVQRVLVPALVPGEFRGAGYALYYLVLGVSALAANVVFGTLWNYVSVEAAYTYSLTTSFVGIIGFVILLFGERWA